MRLRGTKPPAGNPPGRWRVTAAWIAPAGSGGSTGASEPNATSVPASASAP
jgi:hypothetical protein